MSEDTEKYRALLSALMAAQGKGDGSFGRAVMNAFEHAFDHLGRLNDHIALGGLQGGAPHLKPGEPPTLR